MCRCGQGIVSGWLPAGLPRTVLAAEACLFFSRPPKATAPLKPLKPLSAPLAATLQRSLGNHQGQGELPRNDTLATATHPGPEGCLVKGAEEGLRGAVALGSLEQKRQASAASTVRGSPACEPPRHNTLATARLPRLRCRFAAKGAEEGLRGAVAFGSLEKKRRANAHLPSTDRH